MRVGNGARIKKYDKRQDMVQDKPSKYAYLGIFPSVSANYELLLSSLKNAGNITALSVNSN